MSCRYRPLPAAALAMTTALILSGCGANTGLNGGPGAAPVPAALPPQVPATIRPTELVGRYGLASYNREQDRVRTEKAAAGQCSQPYVISLGPGGGVVMYLADQAKPQELSLKGSQSGVNYIGLPGEPAGSPQDREIVSFNGRTLVTRFEDPDAAKRYGTMVYVRCGPRA